MITLLSRSDRMIGLAETLPRSVKARYLVVVQKIMVLVIFNRMRLSLFQLELLGLKATSRPLYTKTPVHYIITYIDLVRILKISKYLVPSIRKSSY